MSFSPGPGSRPAALLALFLLCLSCEPPLGEVFFHPTVERRVQESLAMPPVPGPEVGPDSFRFAMFGDLHIRDHGFHRLDWFREEVAARGIDFVCVLGDLTEHGTGSEVRLARELLDRLGVPVFAAPGNHDLWSSGSWDRFKEHFGPGCKSFRAGPVRIILFDTSCGTVGPTQFRWLEQELARDEELKVLGTHYPLYDGRMPNVSRLPSEAERYRLSARLRDARAWGLVSGHTHGFRALRSAGVRYLIAGTMGPRLDYGGPGYLLFTFRADSLAWEFVPQD